MSKKGKRILSVVLTAAMMLSMSSSVFAANEAAQEKQREEVISTEYSESRSGDVLGEAQELTGSVPVDKSTSGIRLPYSGYFTSTVSEERSFKFYIPEDFEYKTYQVVVNVPEGMDTADFLVESGWVDLADEHNFILRVLEPGENGWGAEDDYEYIASVMSKNTSFTTMTYTVGYGEGGSVLQQYVMANAATVSAAAFVDASDVSGEYMDSMADSVYNYTSGVASDIRYCDVPVPVWIIDEDTEEAEDVIDYWMEAGDINSKSVLPFHKGKVYLQDQNKENPLTPVGNINRIAVLEQSSDVTSPKLAEMIYEDFLSDFVRYGGTTIGSNSLLVRPDYEKLGVKTYSVQYNDIRRDYMVYVPRSVQLSGKDAPVVFTLHGNGSGYRMIFDTSGWWQVADKYGFIVVAPNGVVSADSVNLGSVMGVKFTINDEAGFFQLMLDDLQKNYNIDMGRLYLHGQSQGHEGIVGLVEAMPETFACINATTRIAYPIKSDFEYGNLPGTFYMAGQFDMTKFSLSEGTETKSSDLANFLRYLGIDWETGSNNGEVRQADKVIEDGRYTTYEWYREDGSFAFATTKVENRGHSMLASDTWKIWEEGFSKWSREEDGTLVYNGNSNLGYTTHAIKIKDTENGTVKASLKRAVKGTIVTLTVKADEGYKLDKLTVKDTRGNEIKLISWGKGKYSFTMPVTKAIVKASFAEDESGSQNPTKPGWLPPKFPSIGLPTIPIA